MSFGTGLFTTFEVSLTMSVTQSIRRLFLITVYLLIASNSARQITTTRPTTTTTNNNKIVTAIYIKRRKHVKYLFIFKPIHFTGRTCDFVYVCRSRNLIREIATYLCLTGDVWTSERCVADTDATISRTGVGC